MIPVVLPPDNKVYDKETGEELYCCLIGAVYGHPAAARRWAQRRDGVMPGPCFNFKDGAPPEPEGARVRRALEQRVQQKSTKRTPEWIEKALRAVSYTADGHVFSASKARFDPSLTMYRHEWPSGDVTKSFVLCHTDDLDCISQSESDLEYIMGVLDREFGIKETPIDEMLGLSRKTNAAGDAMDITMAGFIDALYDEFKSDWGTRIPQTPVPPGMFIRSVKDGGGDPATAKALLPKYRRLVGSLLWCARMAYPQCACGCSMLCRVMCAPTEEAFRGALHMMAYLKGMRLEGIRVKRVQSPVLRAFYDASNNVDDGRVMGGFCVFLGNTPIEWNATKMRDGAQSSQHGEYQALCVASKAVQWLRQLLEEMGFSHYLGVDKDGKTMPTVVSGDNDQATMLAREDKITPMNRWIERDTHFSKEAFEKGYTCPRRTPGVDNVVDGLTKSLPTTTSLRLTPQLCETSACGLPPPPPAPKS